jgi:hypothetical protein
MALPGTTSLLGNMTTNPPNLERGNNLIAVSTVPLAILIGGYILFFLLSRSEASAGQDAD